MKSLIIFVFSLFLFSCFNDKKGNGENTNIKKINKKESIAKIKSMQDTGIRKVEFPSKDGLLITGDLYNQENAANFILLCHQAGYSRGEYMETAKRLNTLGFRCLAIDQRSGKEVNKVVNETAKRAKKKGFKTTYLDAKQDIEAAIDYAYELNNKHAIIIVGSSYSASLVLLIATRNDKVKAVASFSPGEYLKGVEVANSIKEIHIPVFVTSSKKEITKTASLIKEIQYKKVLHFKPEVTGIHGSRALWKSTVGNDSYWSAFKDFLTEL